MPFVSKSQQRLFFAKEKNNELPPGTAKRWAAHTKNMKNLPEHKKDKETEKKAFVAAFLLKCAAEGITAPGQVARAAEQLVTTLRTKQAEGGFSVPGILGGMALAGPLLGSVALPTLGGYVGGHVGGLAHNKLDEDDFRTLALNAEANAYRRRAALAKTHAQVRQLLASDPSKYVVLGNQ